MKRALLWGLTAGCICWGALNALPLKAATLTEDNAAVMLAAASETAECALGAQSYRAGAYDKAFAHFQRAAKLAGREGSGEADFWLYRCYFNGKGVKADSAAALVHLKRSGQAHYGPACAALGEYYEGHSFPDIGNSGGRFRGENTLDGVPHDGQVYRDSRANGAQGWSGRESQMAIAAEWYAAAGEAAICPGCATGHDLADFEKALGYFNKAVAIYPWMSAERDMIAEQLQGALRGERVWHEGAEEYRFVDTQEMRDSRIPEGELIWVMGIVEPRSYDGTGFCMKVKDSDKGYPADIYVKIDTVKTKPRVGTAMVHGRYAPASDRWGTPVTLYEVEEIRDMTPSGSGEVWYHR